LQHAFEHKTYAFMLSKVKVICN